MNADKIINIPIGIINGFGTVYLPRITAMHKENKEESVVAELYKAIELYAFVIFALASGIAAVAKEFVPIFFGGKFGMCVGLIIVFVPAFVFKSFSCYFRTNVLIPFNREKQYTNAVLWGALSNLCANIILIPQYKAYGAVWATVIAEIVVFMIQLYKLPIKLSLNKCVKLVMPYFIFGVIMLAFVRLVSYGKDNGIILLSLEVIMGMVTYLVCCLLFWKTIRSKLQ